MYWKYSVHFVAVFSKRGWSVLIPFWLALTWCVLSIEFTYSTNLRMYVAVIHHALNTLHISFPFSNNPPLLSHEKIEGKTVQLCPEYIDTK